MAGDFAAQLRQAAADLRAMSTEVRRGVRPALVEAAQPMVSEAKANASWSSRIPGAIRARVLKNGVDIVVNRKKAPHARPYEGITGNDTFRHPVHGRRDRWVEQKTRPYLEPAVEQHRGKVRVGLERVVSDAARRHGFR
jgi:hypothetical protein